MKKTQKLLSLVVVLAFALSMCSISAFAAKQVVSSTTTDLVDIDFSTGSNANSGTTLTNNVSGITVKGNPGGGSVGTSIADGILVVGDGIKGRLILTLSQAQPANGIYTVTFRFKTPDTAADRGAFRVYGFGGQNNFETFVETTVSNGTEKIGDVTITPGEWYDFEATLNCDDGTYSMKVEDTVIKSGVLSTAAGNAPILTNGLGRIIDTGTYSTRIFHYDDFVVTKTTNTYKDDGVNPYIIGDFSGTGSATAANFKDAAGSTGVTAQLLNSTTVNNGIMTVAKGGRVLLKSLSDITSGTYTVDFEFMRPETLTTGSGVKVYGFGHDVGGGNAFFTTGTGTSGSSENFYLYTGNSQTDGKTAMVEIVANEWYDFKATIAVTYDESAALYTYDYVATVDGVVVDNRTTTSANPMKRIFDYAGPNSTGEVRYKNFTIKKMTKNYVIEDVTVANGKISARLLSNVAPAATFFAAIYEDGTLTSLKAISDYSYFTPKEVGTYDVNKNVEVKWYAWASKGLMPVYTYTAQ